MNLEDHCSRANAAFGLEFREVHVWLDEFAGRPGVGMKHRRFRHHCAGIEHVRRRWGDDAANAAKQHIADDLREEGWRDTDRFPKDEADYVRMGLF